MLSIPTSELALLSKHSFGYDFRDLAPPALLSRSQKLRHAASTCGREIAVLGHRLSRHARERLEVSVFWAHHGVHRGDDGRGTWRGAFNGDPRASRGTPPQRNVNFAARVCGSEAWGKGKQAESEIGDAGQIRRGGDAKARCVRRRVRTGPRPIQRGQRRKTRLRFWTLIAVALGAGVIGVLALAWSTADGRLRLELQSAVLAPISPRTVGREGSDEEIDRLRREAEALKNEITELTEAREQAAHTVAALKAAEQEPRNPAPSAYWYSNPAALTFGIESRPEPGGRRVASPTAGNRPSCIAEGSAAREPRPIAVGGSAVNIRGSLHKLKVPKHARVR